MMTLKQIASLGKELARSLSEILRGLGTGDLYRLGEFGDNLLVAHPLRLCRTIGAVLW